MHAKFGLGTFVPIRGVYSIDGRGATARYCFCEIPASIFSEFGSSAEGSSIIPALSST